MEMFKKQTKDQVDIVGEKWIVDFRSGADEIKSSNPAKQKPQQVAGHSWVRHSWKFNQLS